MPVALTPDQLAELREFDTPTICNAIETFAVRDGTQGYMGMNVRCLFPEMAPVVGYAVTCKGDSTTFGRSRDAELAMTLWDAVDAAPDPVILVIQDMGNAEKSCHAGDMLATTLKALGGVALVTDGGVRDVAGIQEVGVQCFARGIVPAHGTTALFDAGEPVAVDGVPIKTGDLIHGDANGVVAIPGSIATKVALEARKVLEAEAKRREYIGRPGFSAAANRKYFQS